MNSIKFSLKSLFSLWSVLSFSTSLFAQNLPGNQEDKGVAKYVNPFVGTGGHGHTFPGAVVPFGMVQLSPDTRNDASWDGCGGYHYDDSFVYGFTHTHLSGTGVSDWGDVLIMPLASDLAKKFIFKNATDLRKRAIETPELFYNYGDFVASGDSAFLSKIVAGNKTGASLKPDQYRQPLKHNLEDANAGYYTNYFENLRCNVKLTAGKRVGYHQYYFDKRKAGTISTSAQSGNVDTVYFLVDLQHRDLVLSSHVMPLAVEEYRLANAGSKDKLNNEYSTAAQMMSAGYKSRVLVGERSSKAWADNQQLFFAIEFANEVVGYSYLNERQMLVAVQIGKTNKVDIAVALSSTSSVSAWLNLQYELESAGVIENGGVPSMGLSHKDELEKMRISLARVMNKELAAESLKTSNGASSESSAMGSGNQVRINQLFLKFVQSSLTGAFEPGHWNFEKKRFEATEMWETEFGKIAVKRPLLTKGASDLSPEEMKDEKYAVFYTALYHTMIHPSLCSDVFGFYRGRDHQIHWADHEVFTVYSLWDTYRALHPLLTIIDARRTRDFVRSFMLQFDQAKRLPVWELSACETNCMIGYHSVSVIADAYLKGMTDLPQVQRKWLLAMVESARKDHDPTLVNNLSIDTHNLSILVGPLKDMKLGYYGIEQRAESVSKILEYAYDDWCIARMAKELKEEEIAKEFFARSERWRNVFDAETGFMRPRANGGWLSPFEPKEVNNHYTEANAWQYSMYVPQDVMGLIDALGGEKAARAHLDSLFGTSSSTKGREQADITGLIGQYAHGNEPSHHMAYLYNYVGSAEKTQYLVNKICNEFYKNAPDGLIGNEDCGQMSAWYVMSAMGFYPVAPGSNLYLTGSPQFGEIEIARNNGVGYDEMSPYFRKDNGQLRAGRDKFVIRVVNGDGSSAGVTAAASSGKGTAASGGVGNEILAVQMGMKMDDRSSLIGAPVSDQWHLVVSHSDLMEWDAFLFRPVPADRKDQLLMRMPKQNVSSTYAPGLLFEGEKVYRDSHFLTIKPLSNWGGKITLLIKNHGERDVKFNVKPESVTTSGVDGWDKYVFKASAEPIVLQHRHGLEVLGKIDSTMMISGLPGSRSGGVYSYSDWTYGEFNPVPNNYDIVLSNKYQDQYTGGGNGALIDGVRGGKEWRAGGWQGFYDVPLVAKIDMHTVKKVTEVKAGFLQDSRAWIIFPKAVKVYYSVDGVKYSEGQGFGHNIDAMDEEVQMMDATFTFKKPIKARYIMVFAENYGLLPEGHLGYPYQGKAHLFADEIQIKIKK